MSFEYAQRRRLAIAVALTVILVPAAFLLNRDDEPAAEGPPITAIGTVPQPGAITAVVDEPTTATSPTATDVMGTSPVDILDDPLPDSGDDPATIAIPRVPQSVTGPASFSRNISQPTGCYAPAVPFNTRITVTNLDNSRSISCINNVRGTRPDEAVVLHADAFLEIADLTDAPVPVQLTW